MIRCLSTKLGSELYIFFAGLYRGLAPLFYFAIPKNAVRFFAAEQARNYYRKAHGHVNSAQNFMAGLVGSFLLPKYLSTSFLQSSYIFVSDKATQHILHNKAISGPCLFYTVPSIFVGGSFETLHLCLDDVDRRITYHTRSPCKRTR